MMTKQGRELSDPATSTMKVMTWFKHFSVTVQSGWDVFKLKKNIVKTSAIEPDDILCVVGGEEIKDCAKLGNLRQIHCLIRTTSTKHVALQVQVVGKKESVEIEVPIATTIFNIKCLLMMKTTFPFDPITAKLIYDGQLMSKQTALLGDYLLGGGKQGNNAVLKPITSQMLMLIPTCFWVPTLLGKSSAFPLTKLTNSSEYVRKLRKVPNGYGFNKKTLQFRGLYGKHLARTAL